MSGQRLDALQVRKYKANDGTEKAAFTKIGVAFPTKSGDGYMLQLEAIPAPEDGLYRILLKEPRQDGERGGGQRRGGAHESPSAGNGGVDDSDTIPF